MLRYYITGRGIENAAKQLRVMELARTDDGSIPDFVYCCHPEQDWGFIDPHPLSFFTSRVRVRTADGEIYEPSL
jgi:hypothetical protein